MSGHSKWANIKFRKERQDAQRSKVFTRIIKEITIAARMGGGDVDVNPRLRTAVQNAKSQNMPSKNIENAIKKGTGDIPGVVYEEVTYEGYGPGGVALLICCTTDNKNRTVSEVRYLLNKYNGNLGETGSVSWSFDRKGLIRVPAAGYDEDELMLLALDAGAEDFQVEEDVFEIVTAFDQLENIRQNLESQGIRIESAEITYIPQNTVPLDGKQAEQMLKLMQKLEENEDVQNVYANFDIDETVMENFS